MRERVSALLARCGITAYAFETINVENFLTFTFSYRFKVSRTIRLVWIQHEKKGQTLPSANDQWIRLASAPSGHALEICAYAFPDVQKAFLRYLDHNSFPPPPLS
jgi:hypothetical protein